MYIYTQWHSVESYGRVASLSGLTEMPSEVESPTQNQLECLRLISVVELYQ